MVGARPKAGRQKLSRGRLGPSHISHEHCSQSTPEQEAAIHFQSQDPNPGSLRGASKQETYFTAVPNIHPEWSRLEVFVKVESQDFYQKMSDVKFLLPSGT